MNIQRIFTLALVTVLFAAGTVAPVFAQTTTPTPTVTRKVGQIKAAAIERAKEVSLKIFNEHFIARLQTVKTNVNANAKISTEAKATIVAKLDAEISWFTQQRDTVNSATTIAQVRSITATARTRFNTTAKEIRRLHIAVGYVVSLEKVITNLEKNILPKIEGFLTQLTAKGINVQEEQALFDTAKEKVAAAKAELPLIKASATFDEAKKHFDLAKASIKAARDSLKGISTSLKAKLPKVTVTVAPTTVTPTATPTTTAN